MSIERLALVTPERSSSGGHSFFRNLLSALTHELGKAPDHIEVPPTGRIDPRNLGRFSHVVFIGSRAVRVPGSVSVFWALNVAPLELRASQSRNTSARNLARHKGLMRRLRQSTASCDGLVFGSMHARTLYQSNFAVAARLPYSINPGGSSSGLDVGPRRPDNACPLLLVVSHLYPYKGILEFVEAAGVAIERLPPAVRFRVAGARRDETYARAVTRRIHELGLEARFDVGPASEPELARLYSSCTLAVFPSTCENAGSFALFDGIHAGVPTLCSDRSSMPEMVGGYVDLVNPFDTEAFADRLVHLVDNASKRAKLGEQAVQWSASAPTWRQRAQALLAFVDEVG